MGIENPTGYLLWACITIALVATGSYGIDLFTGKKFDLKRRGLLIVAVGVIVNATIAMAWKGGVPDPNAQIIISCLCGIFFDQIIAKRAAILSFFVGKTPTAKGVVDVLDEDGNPTRKNQEVMSLRRKDSGNGNNP